MEIGDSRFLLSFFPISFPQRDGGDYSMLPVLQRLEDA